MGGGTLQRGSILLKNDKQQFCTKKGNVIKSNISINQSIKASFSTMFIVSSELEYNLKNLLWGAIILP